MSENGLRHSGYGIASLIISLIMSTAIFILFATIEVMDVSTPGDIEVDSSDTDLLLGTLLVAVLFGVLVAFGLGIAGLVQNERNKVFALLGLVFSSSIILVFVLILVLGFQAE